MACHRLPALVGGYSPVFNSTIGMKDEMLIPRARVTDRGFLPMTHQSAPIPSRVPPCFFKFDDFRGGGFWRKRKDYKGGRVRHQTDWSGNVSCSHGVLRTESDNVATR